MDGSCEKIVFGTDPKETLRDGKDDYIILRRYNPYRLRSSQPTTDFTLEEIEILKAASSKHLLNDVIAGQNGPTYKLLPTSVI